MKHLWMPLSISKFTGTTLDLYNKSVGNVVALIAGNGQRKTAISKQLFRPLIGCSSHRISFVVKNNLIEHEAAFWKVHALMVEFRILEMAAKLRLISRQYSISQPVRTVFMP